MSNELSFETHEIWLNYRLQTTTVTTHFVWSAVARTMVKPQLFIDIIIRKRFRGHRSAGFCQNDATVNVVNQVSQTKPLGRSWSVM